MDYVLMFTLYMIFCIIFEPILINLIYMSNVDLFLDLILTKKNQDKLINRIIELENKKED